MNSAILDIRNASRSFADRQALQDVSLGISSGEIVALLGPNGSGKTSLMRAVAGRLKLDSGSVRILGLDPARSAEARSALGIVPQTIALYPHLTARQNLEILAGLEGLDRAAGRRAAELGLGRAGLVDRADDLLPALSGGMRRRLNIVAGTLHEPKLLLLDEPTVGVDAHARESIHALLQTLRQLGIGILFSTHDFDQAAQIADRAAFLFRGRLLLEGPVRSLIESRFGNLREAVVKLAEPVTRDAPAILEATGLTRDPENHTWYGPLSGGYGQLAELETRLEQSGSHVIEMRVREPGLGSVFRQLVEQESRP